MPEESASDQQLLDAAGRGDARAFETLYLRHRDWVVSLAYRFTGDREAALDVMQETFLYVLRKTPGLRLTAQMRTFLYPAVKHLSQERLRKDRRFRGGEAAEAAAEARAAGGAADAGQGAAGHGDLAALVASLPEPQREALLLRFVDGLSLQEVADALGVPLGTVKSRLHHAIAALRKDERVRKFFEP